MSKIKIKNFGPIKEGFRDADWNEWMDIKKVTVFIGNQGSGKSTVAKVISTMMWIEKALNRRDFDEFHLTKADLYDVFKYHGISSYFRNNTVLEYQGKKASIIFNKHTAHPEVKLFTHLQYDVPKIMYVPDGRSFLSVIKSATGVRGLPEPLFEFAEEYKRGQADTKGEEVPLPINGVNYKYEQESDSSFIIGKDFRVNLLNASSGFQSLVPLFLVSSSLANSIKNGSEISSDNISVDQSLRMNKEIANIMLNKQLNDEEKLEKSNEVKARFQNKVFINIVEEPEQNLFPTSQQQMLNSLLEFNNISKGNKLIVTTHSPYLVNYLSIAVQGGYLLNKIENENRLTDFINQFNHIVPKESVIKDASDLAIYQLDEKNGTISKLPNPEGIPSDRNYLNQSLRHGNEMFDSLLEIEQEL